MNEIIIKESEYQLLSQETKEMLVVADKDLRRIRELSDKFPLPLKMAARSCFHAIMLFLRLGIKYELSKLPSKGKPRSD